MIYDAPYPIIFDVEQRATCDSDEFSQTKIGEFNYVSKNMFSVKNQDSECVHQMFGG